MPPARLQRSVHARRSPAPPAPPPTSVPPPPSLAFACPPPACTVVQVAALGFAPGMFLLPVILYLGARRGRLSTPKIAGLWAFFAFFVAACIVSGVGAMWLIVDTADTWHFYS